MSFWIFIYVFSTDILFSTDETITGYAAHDVVYELIELNGETVEVSAFMMFPKRQAIEVLSPCFARSGQVTFPTPWFNFLPTDTVERACIITPFEEEFHNALTTSTLVETAQGFLIFSNDDGPLMVLRAPHY